MELITPKYLNKGIASQAVDLALNAVVVDNSSFVGGLIKRSDCHIVILVPAMEDVREAGYPDYPHYPLQPYILYERSVGVPAQWKHPFSDIARYKALQLWTDRNDDRTCPIPHLLFSGDTPYWGGVKRCKIVVACSGFQPWFDKMVSGIVADVLIALAHNAYEVDPEKDDADFLT